MLVKKNKNKKNPEKQHIKRTFLTKNFNLFQQIKMGFFYHILVKPVQTGIFSTKKKLNKKTEQ